eukprot:TRINITY_DN19192_c0_g1_i1.p1 TRINITY_DN19192_c0_g1~~TRINITY_DN19192_c0_g1_i1.p1  ORF type:complete len:488 (+),score=151.80 TRINITY_DN19192_c0_g1_i1:136-1599(+)
MSAARHGLVTITRSELALRSAQFPTLHPVTKSFELSKFSTAVDQTITRAGVWDASVKRDSDRRRKAKGEDPATHAQCVDDVLLEAAKEKRSFGSATVHILPIHRNLVRHGRLTARAMKEICPSHVAMPVGECDLYNGILRDTPSKQYCYSNYATRADYLEAEAEFLGHCLVTPGLQDVVNRRILVRPPPLTSLTRQPSSAADDNDDDNPLFCPPESGRAAYLSEGLRNAPSRFSFQDICLTHFPFFYAAYEARIRKARVLWCGVPPVLFETRARQKTLAVEWERNLMLEDSLVEEGRFGEWLEDYVRMKRAALTPQELVSDLNMRVCIRQLHDKLGAGKKKGTAASPVVLLPVPLCDFHLAVGWVAAVDSITDTSLNECLDDSLDVVPSFLKARKSPDYLEIERAVHMDTSEDVAQSVGDGDAVVLANDPRLSHPAGAVNNPMVTERLRPSSAVRVLEVGPDIGTRSSINACEITPEAAQRMRWLQG